MGRFRSLTRLGRRLNPFGRNPLLRLKQDRWHRCTFDRLEDRQLLAADIYLGSVYLEPASGDDSIGNLFEITFTGGAPGTQLKQIVIDGDKLGDGLSIGDTFYDITPGGIGAFKAYPFEIVSANGFNVSSVDVVDGSTKLTIDLDGFEAGMKLVFRIDVDEMGFSQANSVAEGREFEGARLSAVFDAPHYHTADGETRYWDIFDDDLAVAASAGHPLDLPNQDYMPPSQVSLVDMTAGAFLQLTQEPLPITLSGTVFEDHNLNNQQDPGDDGIAGVELSLLELSGSVYVDTGRVAVTDSNGFYEFDDILPGSYRIVQTQPAPYFSVGATAGQVNGGTRGVVDGTDIITDIALLGGEDSVSNDFAEALPAKLSGHVYHDRNNDGIRDPGEEGIAGVELLVQYAPPSGPAPTPISVMTDANGFWSVDGLMPGTYHVTQVQPNGWLDGLDRAGSAGGVAQNPGDAITDIFLGSHASGINYDFGELLPGVIQGRVYVGIGEDCEWQPGLPPLAGVTVWLLDGSGQRIRSTTTDSNGEYRFTDLPLGTYGVEQIQPDGYFNGGTLVGTLGGVVSQLDVMQGIVINSGDHGFEYNFCEKLPVSIHGTVYVDRNNNGAIDFDEPGIGGVTLRLLDANNQPTGQTTVTDPFGNYSFVGLAPGTYGVAQDHPDGYIDGLDTAGTAGGTAHNPGDMITGVALTSGNDGFEYNFGELEPASISGRVFVGIGEDCNWQPGMPPIAGVTVWLLDSNGVRLQSTVTDASGEYQFTNLAPGTYGIEEIQPDGYYNGGVRAGTAGGVTGQDLITQITLGSGVDAAEYNFCEKLPVSIGGTVYVDSNNNGNIDPGERGIAGVTLILLDGSGTQVSTAVTDANGNYKFAGLPAGTYTIDQIQPNGYFDGLDTAGSEGGIAENPGDRIRDIVLTHGTDAVAYNFGELEPASLHGRVFSGTDPDCIYQPGDDPIAGVTIWLLDANGVRLASTTTDAGGEYRFENLKPGVYGVEEIQPQGYFDGGESIGTAGGSAIGNDTITQIALGSGADAVEYNFCEKLPAEISGYVFRDGDPIQVQWGVEFDPAGIRQYRSGQRKPGDVPIAGVVMRLGNAVGEPILDDQGNPITTVTDANGFYRFTGLRQGVYTVFQEQPTGFIDGLNTAGTTGGIAINRGDDISPTLLAVPHNFDAIARIPVVAGEHSQENNFSEVQTFSRPPFFPPPETPPETPLPPPPPGAPAPRFTALSPILPPNVVRPVYYGGIGYLASLGYTWHLSVIDAGFPRGDEATTGVIYQANSRFNVNTWSGVKMNEGVWKLPHGDGFDGVDRRIFGVAGGIPVTGDFNGDGVTDVGIFINGEWFIDLNGNGVWDEGDLWVKLGKEGDTPVTGDWDGDGKTDVGIFGPAWEGDLQAIVHEPGLPDSHNFPTGTMKNVPPEPHEATLGKRTLKRTAQGKVREDLIDHVFHYGGSGDVPVSGDWNGDGIHTIGLFRGGVWILDSNGNGRWDVEDEVVHYGQPGDLPVVGDWNGDGRDELGVFRGGKWIVDSDANRRLEAHDQVFELGEAGDLPVVGDWNGDGRDQIGVYQDGEVVESEY